jgi:O-antigen/teichoic acid export membrane protein
MTTDVQATATAVRPHIIRGSLWMIAMRWSVRGLGLVSTIVLARLLTPADFGLVAMAMLVVGLIEIFSETGQKLALIRLPGPTREHFDSAWTVQVLVCLGLGAVVLAAAPLGAVYFDEPRVTALIQVLSIRVFLLGFENIGVVEFLRNLDFRNDFRYGVYKKLVAFTVTITLAVALRNHWALIWGTVAGQAGAVVISYVVHPYRPRPCLRKIREIWSCSIWMLVGGVGRYFYQRTDRYVIGALGEPQILGHYTLGAELAELPAAEVIVPASRALIPNFAKLREDPQELAGTYLNVLSVVAVLAASSCAGLAVVADDLVALLLGPQWGDSADFISWLAIASGVAACSNTVMYLLQAVGEPRRVATQSWARVAVLLPTLAVAAHVGGIALVAPAFLVAVVLLVPVFAYNLMAVVPVTLGALLRVIWRPVLAAAVMAWGVAALSTALKDQSAALRLALEVPAGAAVFSIVLYSLWCAAGRPEGAERAGARFLIDRIGAFNRSFRATR